MSERLSRHVLQFGRELRANGFSIGPYETMEALRALSVIDLADSHAFRFALRLVFCSNPEQLPVFDRVFDQYFRTDVRSGTNDPDSPLADAAQRKQEPASNLPERQEKRTNNTKQEEQESREQTLGTFRFSSLIGSPEPVTLRIQPDGLPEMILSARSLAARLQMVRSRRWQRDRKGKRLDFRSTWRKGLETGGDWLELAWRGHPFRKAEFVLLCDGSRSMSMFTERILQFAYALTRATRKVEVFLFSTGLKRITPLIAKKGIGGLPFFEAHGNEWGGGTRIGESLAAFVHQHADRMLHPHTVVFIASDGLDTGEIEKLKTAMQEIHRRAARVVWLNPLKRMPGYQPEARGMKAALPYVDIFSDAQDAASFRRLASQLFLRR